MLNVTSGAPAVCRLAAASRAFLDHPPDGFCSYPLLSARGLLWVGRAGAGALLDDLVTKAPAEAIRWDPSAARELVPALSTAAVAAGGVFEPGAMAIDVAELVSGFVSGLRRRGGAVLASSEAVVVRREAGGWRVTAGAHDVWAPTVVNAAGAWADIVAARAGVRPLGVQPLRRTAAIVPAPDHVAAWPMVMDAEGTWYAAPEPGGLLVSAADETPSEPTDAQPEEIDVALAIERVEDALGLGIRSVRRAWAGLRTFTPDRVPAAGPDPDEPSFVWLVGQGGAGIKTAPALSEIVADAILHGVPVPTDLDPARFRAPSSSSHSG